MRTIYILGLGAAGAIGAALGCATVIGLSPAEQMACTDPADQAVLVGDQANFLAKVLGCAAPHSGDLGSIRACIQATDMLSKPCVDCAAVYGACASQQCSMKCSMGGAGDYSCQTCIAAYCNPTLIACGGTPIDACIASSDQAALQKHAANFEMDMKMCGAMLPNGTNAVVACIQQMDELSQPCALCYSQEDICALTQCPSCPKDPTSSDCAMCVGNLCVPAFTLCSGLAPDAGP